MEDTTVQLFRKYLKLNEKTGELDASQVLSAACYMEWLAMKRMIPKKPAEAFRKAITGHTRGDNGLHPFCEEMEAAMLKVLRVKRVWPCFAGTPIKIGLRGFQTEGFWERTKRLGYSQKRKRTAVKTGDSKTLKRTRRESNLTELTEEECSEILGLDFGPFLDMEYDNFLLRPFSLQDFTLFTQNSFFTQSALNLLS